MRCLRVRQLIPLHAGNDLRPRLERAVRAHIDSCPACRRELEDFRLSLDRVRAAAAAEGSPDWGEGEWQALMARVSGAAKEAREGKEKNRGLVIAPRWAAAAGLGVFFGLVILGVLMRDPFLRPGRPTHVGQTVAAAQVQEQDKVAVTMVSPETGLQIVWILDKNFDWKGDKE
jgi:anti-sigma factor RsiW